MLKRNLIKAKNIVVNSIMKLDNGASFVINALEKYSERVGRMALKLLKISLVLVPIYISFGLLLDVVNPPKKQKINLDKSLLDQKYTGPSHEDNPLLYGPVVRLTIKDESGNEAALCSAVAISDYYALTAAHCIYDDGLMKEELQVYNNKAELITTARAAGYFWRPDIGILRGDFSKFMQLKVRQNTNFSEQISGQFVSCGYPHGSKLAFCDKFLFKQFNGFSIAGMGILIPGMSGGPTIDTLTGEVVGINVLSGNGPVNAEASLLIGFSAIFEIEP